MTVTLAEINGLEREEFTAGLGHLFEHSPWVARETWPRRPFATVEGLHAALCATLQGAPEADQLALIRAHPDLAGRLAQMGQLTQESTREQASAGLDRLPAEEMAAFQRLNDDYRQRFGFPFVICARLNRREAIFEAMRKRLGNAAGEERKAALAEIEKIAWLRLQDVVS